MKHDAYLLSDMGIVCALGAGVEEVSRRSAAGDTAGMKRLSSLAGGDSTFFGFAAGFPAVDALSPVEPFSKEAVPRVGRLVDAAMSQICVSLAEAVREFGAERIGGVVGTSNSTMEEFTSDPVKIDMSYPAMRLKERWGVRGPCLAVSTACSSSGKAFAAARRMIESGSCDAVVVGGADAYTRTVVEGFHSLEALSPSLCKPLSPDRDGINLGEGAAFFIMRRARRAARKGDVAVCLAGVGESSDAYHLTAPDPSGKGAEDAMRRALADASLSPGGVDFINLHGTGTVYNDSMECAAVERVFGRRSAAPKEGLLSDGLAVEAFSTKRMTGHCLGAAGAIEAALSWIRLAKSPGACLSNSFAFGGSNASIALVSRYL